MHSIPQNISEQHPIKKTKLNKGLKNSAILEDLADEKNKYYIRGVDDNKDNIKDSIGRTQHPNLRSKQELLAIKNKKFNNQPYITPILTASIPNNKALTERSLLSKYKSNMMKNKRHFMVQKLTSQYDGHNVSQDSGEMSPSRKPGYSFGSAPKLHKREAVKIVSIFGDMTVYRDPARNKTLDHDKSKGVMQSQTHQYSSQYNRQLDLEELNDKTRKKGTNPKKLKEIPEKGMLKSMSERDYYLQKQRENSKKMESQRQLENINKLKNQNWKGRSEILHEKGIDGLIKQGYTNNKNWIPNTRKTFGKNAPNSRKNLRNEFDNISSDAMNVFAIEADAKSDQADEKKQAIPRNTNHNSSKYLPPNTNSNKPSFQEDFKREDRTKENFIERFYTDSYLHEPKIGKTDKRHLLNVLRKKKDILDEKLTNQENTSDPIYNDNNGQVKGAVHRLSTKLPADVNFDIMENEILQKQLSQRIKVNQILSFGHLNNSPTYQGISTDYGEKNARGSGLGGNVSINKSDFIESLNDGIGQQSKYQVGRFLKKDGIIKEVLNSPIYQVEGNISSINENNEGFKNSLLEPKASSRVETTLKTQKSTPKIMQKIEKNKIDQDIHHYKIIDNRDKIDQSQKIVNSMNKSELTVN